MASTNTLCTKEDLKYFKDKMEQSIDEIIHQYLQEHSVLMTSTLEDGTLKTYRVLGEKVE